MAFFKLNFYCILIFNTEFNKYTGILFIMNYVTMAFFNYCIIAEFNKYSGILNEINF